MMDTRGRICPISALLNLSLPKLNFLLWGAASYSDPKKQKPQSKNKKKGHETHKHPDPSRNCIPGVGNDKTEDAPKKKRKKSEWREIYSDERGGGKKVGYLFFVPPGTRNNICVPQ